MVPFTKTNSVRACLYFESSETIERASMTLGAIDLQSGDSVIRGMMTSQLK